MPLIDVPQRSEGWYAARAGKITASLAAACLGLDPNRSRASAWREITGQGGQADNRAMAWGRDHEQQARSDYEDMYGELAFETGFWVHPTIPWLGASPDGLVGADGMVEIKCPAAMPKAVPLHHRIQCLIQLAVTGRAWCDYFVWANGACWMWSIKPAGIAGLIGRLEAFRTEFVVPKLEPPRKSKRRKR